MTEHEHNPHKLSPDQLPEGRRFLTRKERLMLADANQKGIAIQDPDIWAWITTGRWDQSHYIGSAEYLTYCVSLNWQITVKDKNALPNY